MYSASLALTARYRIFTGAGLNNILGGGGFASRLTEEVREKRGLAYGIGTYLTTLDYADLWIGDVATQNARVGQSIDLIRQEWKRMADRGPTRTN